MAGLLFLVGWLGFCLLVVGLKIWLVRSIIRSAETYGPDESNFLSRWFK